MNMNWYELIWYLIGHVEVQLQFFQLFKNRAILDPKRSQLHVSPCPALIYHFSSSSSLSVGTVACNIKILGHSNFRLTGSYKTIFVLMFRKPLILDHRWLAAYNLAYKIWGGGCKHGKRFHENVPNHKSSGSRGSRDPAFACGFLHIVASLPPVVFSLPEG